MVESGQEQAANKRQRREAVPSSFVVCCWVVGSQEYHDAVESPVRESYIAACTGNPLQMDAKLISCCWRRCTRQVVQAAEQHEARRWRLVIRRPCGWKENASAKGAIPRSYSSLDVFWSMVARALIDWLPSTLPQLAVQPRRVVGIDPR